MSDATLNRIGILLNVVAGVLLTPQLLGARRLLALEQWARRSSQRLRDSIERWRAQRSDSDWTYFGDEGLRQEAVFAAASLVALGLWSVLIAAARDLRGGAVDWSAPWLAPLQGGAQPWDTLLVGLAGLAAFAALAGLPRLARRLFSRTSPRVQLPLVTASAEPHASGAVPAAGESLPAAAGRASLDATSQVWREHALDKVAVLVFFVAWAPALLVLQSYYALLFVGWGALNRVVVPASHGIALALKRDGGLAAVATTVGIALFIVGNAAQFAAAD